MSLTKGNLRYEECPIYKHADKDTQDFYKVVRYKDDFHWSYATA